VLIHGEIAVEGQFHWVGAIILPGTIVRARFHRGKLAPWSIQEDIPSGKQRH
jgi:hypothetical protein